jgi:tetratricopeptide (TPR) repeat protein
MKRISGCLTTLIALLAGVCAAQEHHATGGSSQPASLLAGLGNQHHPISTKNIEAQRFFDQGLTLVYAFNHEEAVRSFLRAAELDPLSPMPLWGIALAVGPNYNLDINPEREKVAYRAIQEARKLAAHAPENERAYVEALAQRYTGDPNADFKKLAVNYKNAMRELAKKYPDDPDAATLYAESMMDLRPWNLWTSDGKPTEDTEEVIAVLQSVLRRYPKHAGANHFLIHAVEASPHPELGLGSAKRLETLVPAAGHLLHMPSHIYLRIGDYAEATKSNEAAVKADRAYLSAAGMPSGMYGLMYYSHNLQFLALSAGMEGNFSEAKKAADELAANVKPAVNQMPMVEPLLATPALVLARFQRWDDILNLPAPEPSLPMSWALWHYVRGVALAAKGDPVNAQAERKQLAAASPPKPGGEAGYKSSRGVLDIALEVLDARIASAQGDRKASIEHWRRAVATQDALPYNEPPDWYYPVRESLGAALARDGQYEEAERVFRADLDRNPRNPRSLFGLLKALEAQKKMADAQWVRQEFEEAWKSADVSLRIEDL